MNTLHMYRWRLVLLSLSVGLPACSSTPLAVNWYHEPSQVPSAEDDVLVALINRNDRPCDIEGLSVNRGENGSGLHWQPTPRPTTLLPGQVLVVRMSDLKWDGPPFAAQPGSTDSANTSPARCTIPMSVHVQISNCAPLSATELRLTLGRQLPTSLPDGWAVCPGKQQP